MSISELEALPPPGPLGDPNLEPAARLGRMPTAGKGGITVGAEKSGQFTPPTFQPGDVAPNASNVELSPHTSEKLVSGSPQNDASAVKSEPELLTPHYGTDLSNLANVPSNMGPGPMFGMQANASQGVQQGPSQTLQQVPSPGSMSVPNSAGSIRPREAPAMGMGPSDSDQYAFRPPFVVDLDMVRRTMDGVNRILGVDLSDADVSESALLDDPIKDQGQFTEDSKSGHNSEQKDSVVVAKGEYSHMRLICDACGHIVAAVGRAVLDAAKESFDENLKQGTPGIRPKPPVRKKRGGILGFKELAARANLSPWHFHRVFRVTTGVTPKTYGEALWEYLMLESGFNLDNEELTIDRSLKGKSAQGSSPSSSASPQSPVLAGIPQYSPGLTSRSPPVTAPGMVGQAAGVAAAQQVTHGQALPTNGVPGTGRIRKARSRSRPSRSRSRTRSQTQSQVLTTLSALGDNPVTDAVPRGRSFTRAVPPSVSGSVASSMIPTPNMPNGQALPQMGGPAPSLAVDSGASTFDSDWFGPSDDLLSGLGGQPDHNATTHELNLAQLNQGPDVPDLTALSLQQLGLEHPSSGHDGNDMRQAQPAEVPSWHMPHAMNGGQRHSSSTASSAPDLTLLNSGYGNHNTRLDRFQSPDIIANDNHPHQLDGSFSMQNFQHSRRSPYEDNRSMNGFVGGLNMSSFHNDTEFGGPGSMNMPQSQMNSGVTISHAGMGLNNLNQFSDGASPATVGRGLEPHLHSNMSSGPISDTLHEGYPGSYHESLHNNFQDNFSENLQSDMYQQQQGDDIGGLGDLPTSYYMRSKAKVDSKPDDDEFISALIGDDPPMLAPWNEADESPANDYGF